MLRISNLLRGKIMPRKIPARAGLPNWDRPDPPPSVTVEPDHELNDEQIILSFIDSSMPEFIFTTPEVYEGDTAWEAMPMFLKGAGTILGIGALIGLTMWLTNPLKSVQKPYHSLVQMSKKQSEMVQSRQWLEWANKNPMGITLTSEYYPPSKVNDTPNTQLAWHKKIDERENYNLQVNQQVKKYLLNVKQKATKKVQSKLAGSHSHGEASHDQHHKQQHAKKQQHH